ncbi:nucleotide sugar dehydrogenase [bacterium]|nr:nucleotide sugar dehydrogenase [bacterium]
MKIVVVGLGYVGISNAVLLAQQNEVIGVDISQEKVDLLNDRKSPIVDEGLLEFLSVTDLNFRATKDITSSVVGADFVIVSTPTNYDEKTNFFDTSSVEKVVEEVSKIEPNTTIVIKSTVPVGFVDSIKNKFNTKEVIFSPEFLREGHALYDNLYPSRIIVGASSPRAKRFAELLKQGSLKKNVNVLFTGSKEAEAIKLFANTYLAMRVAFFNELDSFALSSKIDSKKIIEGISLDPRIGNYYNNPSFGYGGYCLPKDTKQLLANYDSVPQNIIRAIVEANSTRKDFLADQVISKNPKTVGVFRLAMKAGSDNFRQSAIIGVIKKIKEEGINIVIYEPSLHDSHFYDLKVENCLSKFKINSDIILTNRYVSELEDVVEKVFTRDLFGSN